MGRAVPIAAPLVLLLATAMPARGENPPSPESVADSVVGLVRAKDDATLKTLAAASDPDPWLVVDVLLARSEPAAAVAYAAAASGPGVAKLPAYAAAQSKGRPVAPGTGLRKLVDEARSASLAGRAADAARSLEKSSGEPGTVLAVLVATERALAPAVCGCPP